ncbi:50S ribosomal protein L5 [Thalassoglobus polymorphus]|uniref:Large ribosomal subunit protein uL5 n=1 Tax=Thalassoglobus polymorphus TaxID=2527994 RepID=A0A517QI14_9PLAN|nr:50S ribosomal protein L5 [Thalassoglobus polymorphus]QDT31279.1 50S ribosomal protein L5 [Thalassoglobus polymorphus]
MARFKEKYNTEIVPKLSDQLGRENRHSLPKIEKIVVSMGVGAAIQDQKVLDEALGYLMQITGQKPSVRRSRKSIAQFKLREGMRIGGAVTLRKQRMYEFLDRLITLVLPRVRDFRGVNPNAFDGRGNYSLGLSEQVVFPEVNADKVKNIQGMNIAIVTSAENDDEARLLLKEFGMPFKDPSKKR